MDDEAETLLPPRKEDVLFTADLADGWNNAILRVSSDADHRGYTGGYRRGSRLLVDHVVEQRRDQDYLVYPILFLYRHHAELALKNIVRRLPYLIDRELTEAEKQHLGKHRLDSLWQDLKPMLTELPAKTGWGPLPSDDVEGIDSYIRQFSEIDSESFAFRYTRSKEGVPLLPSDLTHINLRHFAEMWDKLADYLDGLNEALSDLYEARNIEADWQSDMAQYEDF